MFKPAAARRVDERAAVAEQSEAITQQGGLRRRQEAPDRAGWWVVETGSGRGRAQVDEERIGQCGWGHGRWLEGQKAAAGWAKGLQLAQRR